jgi:transcriptional regulator with GAF, ATPase, and Fis domain
MERFRTVMLDVWREACRHIDIGEAAANFAQILGSHMPLASIVIRRLDPQHHCVKTVAIGGKSVTQPEPSPTTDCSRAQWKRLTAWAAQTGVVRRGRRRTLTGELAFVVPDHVEGDVLAAPLAGPSGPIGFVIVAALDGALFQDKHAEMLEAMREPFSVALENDRRLHEIAALREAAEADRRSLLHRLGRTDITDRVVGAESGLRPVMERVELVSRSDAPVLILGETGSGKEVIARAIHNHSQRREGPFIRVNCGAIPSELIDAQLFGHEKGSFTGAEQSRQGWFERADGGTLFLDEIGELPLEAQVRFLRVLQDGFVERVGGHQAIRVEVRIVAATHRDLAGMVRENKFREDLWYRIAVFPILLPPLRDRKGDIPELVQHFAQRAANRFGLAPVAPTEEDIRLLQSYEWPGNIRELGAVIDRAAILGDGKTLEVAAALGFSGLQASRGVRLASPTSPPPPPAASTDGTILTLDEAMRRHIETALRATRGKIEGPYGAAKLLKINPHTLRARMRKLGIQWRVYRNPNADQGQ